MLVRIVPSLSLLSICLTSLLPVLIDPVPRLQGALQDAAEATPGPANRAVTRLPATVGRQPARRLAEREGRRTTKAINIYFEIDV